MLLKVRFFVDSIASALTKFQWFSSPCAPSALCLSQPAGIREREGGQINHLWSRFFDNPQKIGFQLRNSSIELTSFKTLTLDYTPECMLCEMTETKFSGPEYGQSEHRTHTACCSSPKAVCYWLAISLVSWTILGLVGMYWHPLRALGAPTILLAVAIGCFANWIKNRTFHCGITGPLFLIVAVLLLLSETRIIHIGNAFMWPTVLVGSAIAFLLEWR
jgi:hypothetical protein